MVSGKKGGRHGTRFFLRYESDFIVGLFQLLKFEDSSKTGCRFQSIMEACI